MSGEAFVDVTYRGLAVGEKLKLTELGPTTAYLEAPQPLPVGATLDVATESGLTFSVDVIRVQEQVAGAERAPGMRVVARELAGEVASWWSELTSAEDPIIPEPQAQPSAAPAPADPEPAAAAAVAGEIDEGPTQRNAVGKADERGGGDGEAPNKKNGETKGARTQVMSVNEIQAALADGSGEIALDDGGGDGVPEAHEAKRTEVMNADEIRAIAEAADTEAAVDDAQAADAAAKAAADEAKAAEAEAKKAAEAEAKKAEAKSGSGDDSDGEAPSNGEKPARGRRRRRRKRKRRE